MSASLDSIADSGIPNAEESSKRSARGVLVAPIVVIILISLLTTCALVWVSGRVLNRNADSVAVHLAHSLLAARARAVKDLVVDLSSSAGAYERFVADPDPARADELLGRGLMRRHGIATSMVIDSNDETALAFENGEAVPLDAFAVMSKSLRALIAAARNDKERRSAWGLVRSGRQIGVAAVGWIDRPVGDAPVLAGQAPVLVLVQPITEDFLNRASVEYALNELRHFFREPPEAYSSIALTGFDGSKLGYLGWRSIRPGDVVLWWLMPSLSCALIAVAFLLYQFFRSADLVLERQSFLLTLVRRERELRTLKTRFVSMVSHELRTPLATIRSAADLLERYEDKMSPEDKRHETEVIRQSVDRLTGIIENVLVMGRSDTEAARARAVRIELGAFCEEIWTQVAEPLGNTHRLVLSGSAVGRTVSTDDALLGSVLSNLLQNAIKYSPGRDTVIVDINAYGQDCVIRVTDFGPGIGDEEREKIFDAFFRGGSSKATSGTGLGLSVAKAAAERLGGSLTIDTETGEGTTFQLNLPGLMRNRSLRRRKDEA